MLKHLEHNQEMWMKIIEEEMDEEDRADDAAEAAMEVWI